MSHFKFTKGDGEINVQLTVICTTFKFDRKCKSEFRISHGDGHLYSRWVHLSFMPPPHIIKTSLPELDICYPYLYVVHVRGVRIKSDEHQYRFLYV